MKSTYSSKYSREKYDVEQACTLSKKHGGITITGVVSTLTSVQGELINRYVTLECENKKKYPSFKTHRDFQNLYREFRNSGSARATAWYATHVMGTLD